MMHVHVKDINEVIKQKIMSFDKGRLILNPEMLTEDALILSIDDGQLILEDTLTSYTIKAKDYALQKLIPYLDDNYPNFKSDLTYIDMNEVIKILERFASSKKFNFIVRSRIKKLSRTTSLLD